MRTHLAEGRVWYASKTKLKKRIRQAHWLRAISMKRKHNINMRSIGGLAIMVQEGRRSRVQGLWFQARNLKAIRS